MAFVTSLKHFAKCRTGKKFLGKKYQNLIPAKYKATFFYMWMDRNTNNNLSIYIYIWTLWTYNYNSKHDTIKCNLSTRKFLSYAHGLTKANCCKIADVYSDSWVET